MASKHRVTVGEELRYDSDLQGLKNLNGTYAQQSVSGAYVTIGPPTGGDDTALIHAARDAAGPNGRLLFVNAGVYNTPGLNANIAGQIWDIGPGVTIKATAASTAAVITIGANNVEIRGSGNATLDGNRANVTTGTGTCIFAQGRSGARVSNLTAQNTFGYGIWMRDCTDTKVKDCTVTGTALTAIIFDHSATDGYRNAILGCTVDRSAEATSITSAGIQFRAGGGKRNANGRVEQNTVIMPRDVTSAQNWAICIEVNGSHCSVVGNTTYQGQMGISLTNTVGCSVVGNTIRGASSGTAGANDNYGIEVAASPYATITGNLIDGQDTTGTPVTWEGIGLSQSGSISCSVIGNTVRGTKLNGINVSSGCHFVNISANTLETGPGRGITVANSTDPTICGNSVNGAVGGGGATEGIRLWSLATAVNGAVVTGNRVTGYPTGINVQGAASLVTDHLVISSNQIQGCATPLTATLTAGATVGSNTKVVGNEGVSGVVDAAWGQQFVSGTRYAPQVGSAGSAALTASQLVAFPFVITRWPGPSFNEAGIQVTAAVAATTVRLGVYADNNGVPGSLIADWGAIDSSTTGYKTAAITWSPAPGRYWIAAVAQGGTPTVSTRSGSSPYVGKVTADGSGHTTAYISPNATAGALGAFGTPSDATFAPAVQIKAA